MYTYVMHTFIGTVQSITKICTLVLLGEHMDLSSKIISKFDQKLGQICRRANVVQLFFCTLLHVKSVGSFWRAQNLKFLLIKKSLLLF